MTAESVRDIGYISWKDPFAWMESMKGKHWNNLLLHEKHNYNTLAKQVHRETRHMEKEITDVYQYIELPPFTIGNGSVKLYYTYSGKFSWSWSWSTKKIQVDDLDVLGNYVWYATEDDKYAYKNKITCMDAKGKIIWTRDEVSQQIAVIENLCYYIIVTDYFNAIEVRACNAHTGKNERIIYKEPNQEIDLTFWKCSNRTLYLQSSDPINASLFRINGLDVIPLYKSSILQIPLGESIQGDCVLTKQRLNSKWIAHGKPVSDWILPDEDIQFVTLRSGHVLTIDEGSRTIWFCAPRKKPIVLYKIKVGDISPLYWSNWENTIMESYIVLSPFSIPQVIHIIENTIMDNKSFYFENKLLIEKPIQFKPLEVHRFHVPSKDGTRIPYIIVKQKNIKPKAQLIYVYGAYGSTTTIEWPYKIWYSLLQRRWAIVYAMVRGSGDNNAEWANAARRANRYIAVDDFEAVIRDAQHINKLNAKRTVIYGRSAGGIPIGAIVSRYPDGQLIGAAYTEVPYVDLLRTTTNPSLPLTIGEYKEFGNPRESILNFKELLKVSPINALPADGAPGVFVLTRVGLLDRQVYAYESFKWIQHLRGNYNLASFNTKGKYIIFDVKEAHKYEKERYIPTHAQDLAILDAWVDGTLHI
jgi:hypothetical protein